MMNRILPKYYMNHSKAAIQKSRKRMSSFKSFRNRSSLSIQHFIHKFQRARCYRLRNGAQIWVLIVHWFNIEMESFVSLRVNIPITIVIVGLNLQCCKQKQN